MLKDLGFTYCSPAGRGVGLSAGLAVLPFRWPLIDAFHYLPHFAPLRERHLGTGEPQPPARLREALAAAPGGIAVFHPFLLAEDERFAVLREVLGGVRAGPLRELA